jgi:hypothetical protein
MSGRGIGGELPGREDLSVTTRCFLMTFRTLCSPLFAVLLPEAVVSVSQSYLPKR